jgi:hypothetical protein
VSSTSSASSRSDGAAETPEGEAQSKARRDVRSRKRRQRAQRREDRANQLSIEKEDADAKAAKAALIQKIIDPRARAIALKKEEEEAIKAEKRAMIRRKVIHRESVIKDQKILKERAKENIKRDIAAFFREAFLDGGKTKVKTIILKKIRTKQTNQLESYIDKEQKVQDQMDKILSTGNIRISK